MCGIAGWIGSRNTGSETFSQKLRAIQNVIELQDHRGPDANGIWEDKQGNVILGHNRLSIVDLSETGAQPMKDNSGNWIISYNGELYNHNQLREELGKKFNVSFVGKVIQK